MLDQRMVTRVVTEVGREMKRTSRGFGIYGEYKDSRGNVVRIQESSAVGGPYCWIFVTNKDGNEIVPCVGAPNGMAAASPHLSRVEARRVAMALLKFAEGK